MKRVKVIFSPLALVDVKEATDWYNSQQKGLGKRFKDDLKKVISSISLNPFFASIKYENIRTTTCRNFPYSIHFEIDDSENIVRVTSVFHFNREPLWLKR